MRKLLCVAAAIAGIAGSVLTAQETDGVSFTPRFEIKYDNGAATELSTLFGMTFRFDSPEFTLLADLYLANDGKYSPLESNQSGGTFFDYYAFLNAGGLIWRPQQNLTFRAGRLEHRDQLDGPYSLFVSSVAPAALLMEIRYENDHFFYESRWVELNSRSAMYTAAYPKTDTDGDSNDESGPFPDRGANVKAYGLKYGRMRFGLQDAAVYTGRSFDYEYFISPLPQYFTQYVKGTTGRPWTTDSNENDIIGAFWDWQYTDELMFEAQYLLDDLNMHKLGVGPYNPWKAAWALRTKLKTEYGTFSLSHAGAFKYTFGPTRDRKSECYSYTYYPDSRFTIDDPSDSEIAFEDLMFGYKNGENNIAFRLDWENEWRTLRLASYLEFMLSGAKSPTNAWHDDYWHDYEGGRLLDDDELEKRIVLSLGASKAIKDLTIMGSLLVGCAFNALELTEPDAVTNSKYDTVNNNSWIWKPGDDNELILAASVGVKYAIPVTRMLKK